MKHASQMPGLRWEARGVGDAASVSFYTDDEPHDAHEHDAAHISVLLSGCVEETALGSTAEARAGSLRLRPEGFRHAVKFARRGALILTLPAPDPSESDNAAQRDWLPLQRLGAYRDVLRNLFAGVGCDVKAASVELIAMTSPAEASRDLPAWLTAARERIVEEPARAPIETLAEEAGVHRVHFARMFTARFGAPPSVLRRRAMLDHALAGIMKKRRPLADAAAAAGFADQAHMTRAFAEFLGVAPARLRALLR